MSEPEDKNPNAFWTPGRLIATVVVIFIISAGGYVLITGLPELTSPIVNPKLPSSVPGTGPAPSATPAPPDFEIPSLDGKSFRLSQFRGKVLIVDFWATWCLPCRDEIPHLVRLAGQNRDRGLEVVGLHINDGGRSTPDKIRQFAAENAITYRIGYASDELFIAYLGDEDSIPQTLIFDREGKLIKHMIGFDPESLADLEAAVNEALSK